MIALTRGLMGAAFLMLVLRIRGGHLQLPESRATLALLLASGVAVTLNWVFLFMAYERTTLASAELAYEMAPVYVMLVSPFLLGEKLTRVKVACLVAAVAGMVLVSGVLGPDASMGITLEGVGLGLVSAAFFAATIVMNRRLASIEPYTKTIVQLFVAGIVLVPLAEASGELGFEGVGMREAVLIAVVGIVHTGIAFALWFDALGYLPAQTVAILEYIDPIVALSISVLVFHESLTPLGWIGAVLVLGAMAASELLDRPED
jgi:drug/metabolite transporter (DMT)-like permease